MGLWFWYFVIYSFLGYCLEKCYAHWVRSPRQVRKCFLLLPLCPVYGLAMCLTAAMAPDGLLPRIAVGAAVCTGVEYAVHLFYDLVLGVRFWDYSDLPGNASGRVCPRFALIWGLLSAAALYGLHPAVHRLATGMGDGVTWAVWMLLAADGFCSAALLRRSGDPEALGAAAVLAQIRASSQSRTSR